MLSPWGLGDLPTHGLGWLLFPEQHSKEDRLAHRPQEMPFLGLSEVQSGNSHLQQVVTHMSSPHLCNHHSSPVTWA